MSSPAPKSRTRTAKAKKASAANVQAAPAERQIVFDPSADRLELANQAIEDPIILAALVENLSVKQRRVRQFSAATLNVISGIKPELLIDSISQLCDALHRPEAQTRWESLEVLANIVQLQPETCDDAIIGAEQSLYDEESGSTRLAAVRFLCAYGALSADRATRVWPYIDEALQCYHGDPEFQDMLLAITQFAAGDIGKDVKKALGDRVEFDAKNAKGQLGRRAMAISEICKKK